MTHWVLSDPDEALLMVQSWLFFGVLEAALWDSYGGSAHFKETPEGKVIDTKLFRALKTSWELRLSGLGMPIAQWQALWNDTRLKAEAIVFRLGGLARGALFDKASLPFAVIPGISDSAKVLLKYGAVSEYREGMKFVAISHVWSDGLMGTSETGLPGRQIQHPASLAAVSAENYTDPVSDQTPWFLWIDALCIPADSRVRKQAISKMKRVYSEASMTIVLDEGLYHTPDHLTGRLFSKNIYILFSAGLAQLSSLFQDVLAGTDRPIHDHRLHDLAELVGLSVDEVRRLDESCCTRPFTNIEALMLREFRSLPFLTNRELRIRQIAQMLSLRDSSRREDELLAIAPLLGGDVSKLIHMSGEERVKNFWLQLGAILKDVVLLEYPKLSTPGFRCFPRTMLGQNLQMPMHWEYDVRITEKGVRGRYWIYQWSTDCNPTRVNCNGTIVDREARQVIEFCLHQHEPRRNTVPIDAILLLDQPADYSVVRNRPFRALGVSSPGSFHDGCEISCPGRILSCSAAAPLTDWDVHQGGILAAGRIAEIIMGTFQADSVI
ncbi:hypothetical protein TSTA_020870 [Talaromyces stipitatus ATCC 10500]|uniref:Heterokaryon incompatibility domain-containing protein n=1 Tax=Talaromyces stipitatus (strain ATCC 10500 / CBS 375.48 / QM 6759 / NRRL 1006) TaxID=441959 RepID=B8MFN9_TALSN|nr:uncharacterized protein TSTA_020870 [Talaromyces stipitatus ATCC 10500]EED17029.1 hypothetical protein TSTA_020870 [Talaromyces stipitatus ATCC 10500]